MNEDFCGMVPSFEGQGLWPGGRRISWPDKGKSEGSGSSIGDAASVGEVSISVDGSPLSIEGAAIFVGFGLGGW